MPAVSQLEGRAARAGRRSPIVVSLRPDDPLIYVGVDCAGDHSYVSMPTMRAGLQKADGKRELAPALAAVDWQERAAGYAIQRHDEQEGSLVRAGLWIKLALRAGHGGGPLVAGPRQLELVEDHLEFSLDI